VREREEVERGIIEEYMKIPVLISTDCSDNRCFRCFGNWNQKIVFRKRMK
jgi:hypothetical protein